MKKKLLPLLSIPLLALNIGAGNVDHYVHDELVIHTIKYYPFTSGRSQRIDIDVSFNEDISLRFYAMTKVEGSSGTTTYYQYPNGLTSAYETQDAGTRKTFVFEIPVGQYQPAASSDVWLKIESKGKAFLNLGTGQRYLPPTTYRLSGNRLGSYSFRRKDNWIDENAGETYIGTAYETISFRGFQDTVVDSASNRVPLESWTVAPTYCWGERKSFECDKAVLYLLNDFDDFRIGYSAFYERQACWAFDLETIPNATLKECTSFQLKEETSVSSDGRYQRPVAEAGPFFRKTKSLYLPPLEGGASKSYEFVLVLGGADMGGAASYVFPFTYVKTKDHVGPCATSDYCVMEVE